MSLRDQFKKANILSDKESKRLAHEARVERSTKGRETIEQESAQRQQDIDRLQREERERTRRETERLERDRKVREEQAAVEVLLADAKKPGPGAVRFYFATKEGHLPWLELSPREAQEISAGALCVVRVGAANTHTYRLLPLEATRRVAKLRPEVIALAPRALI